MMWFYILLVVLATKQAEAKSREIPPVEEIEVVAGRDSPKMNCSSVDANSRVTWKIGYQELKGGVLDEKWEDLPGVRFEKTEGDSILQIKQVKYGDRSNIKCHFKQNVTLEMNTNNTSINVTEAKDVANYFRVRVRDPLGAVWPAMGVLIEGLALFIIITVFEYIARKKPESK